MLRQQEAGQQPQVISCWQSEEWTDVFIKDIVGHWDDPAIEWDGGSLHWVLQVMRHVCRAWRQWIDVLWLPRLHTLRLDEQSRLHASDLLQLAPSLRTLHCVTAPDLVTERVLRRLTGLTNLSCDNMGNLTDRALAPLSALKCLSLYKCCRITNNALSTLSSTLQSLRLTEMPQCSVSALQPLASHLQSLDCCDNTNITLHDGLLTLTTLTTLVLEFTHMNRHNVNLPLLDQMTHLRALTLRGLTTYNTSGLDLSDWPTGLSALTHLRMTGNVARRFAWYNMSALTSLSLHSYNDTPDSIFPFWSRLQKLDLSNTTYPSDTLLRQLTQLRKLTLGMFEADITTEALLVGPTATVTSLSVFCTDSFTDAHLAIFTRLSRLTLSDCSRVTSLQTLLAMTQLTELYLSDMSHLAFADKQDAAPNTKDASDLLRAALPRLKTPCLGMARDCPHAKCKGRHNLS